MTSINKQQLIIQSFSFLDFLLIVTVTCFIGSSILFYNIYYNDLDDKILNLKKYYQSDPTKGLEFFLQDLIGVFPILFEEWGKILDELHLKLALCKTNEDTISVLNEIESYNIKYIAVIKLILLNLNHLKDNSNVSDVVKVMVEINMIPYNLKLKEIELLATNLKSKFVFSQTDCEKQLWLFLYQAYKQRLGLDLVQEDNMLKENLKSREKTTLEFFFDFISNFF